MANFVAVMHVNGQITAVKDTLLPKKTETPYAPKNSLIYSPVFLGLGQTFVIFLPANAAKTKDSDIATEKKGEKMPALTRKTTKRDTLSARKTDILPIYTRKKKETDTLSVKKPDNLHSPKKASIFSAVLPGLGQAYNRKYWKIPLIYGTFATLGYFIKWNNDFYQESKTAYMDLTDTIPGTNSYLKLPFIEYYDLKTNSGIANLKKNLTRRQDYYHRNRDLLVILTAAFWGLNVIDASVDAHFFNFDISDDLSLNWQPSMMLADEKKIYGFNCTLKF